MYTLWTDFRQDPSKYKDITHLHIWRSYDYDTLLDMNDMKLFESIISTYDCKINHLSCDMSNFDNNDAIQRFIDAIALNRTITDLTIYKHHGVRSDYQHIDMIVRRVATIIREHPCIRSIKFGNFWFRQPVYDLINNIPKTVKHLEITSNDGIGQDELQFILLNSKLQSLNIARSSNWNLILGKIAWVFKINTSIINFTANTSMINSNYSPASDPEIDGIIKSMLTRNRKAWNAAKRAALCLIAIREFRVADYPYFYWIPKLLVIMMAKWIFESYHEPIWQNI